MLKSFSTDLFLQDNKMKSENSNWHVFISFHKITVKTLEKPILGLSMKRQLDGKIIFPRITFLFL